MPRLPDVATTEELKTLEGSAYEHNRRRLRPKVFRRQQKLYVKAKREPRFRFYSLFGQLQLDDLLNDAWDRVAANNGAPGLDGVRVDDLKADPEAVSRLLEGLKDDLRTKSYKPSPVKRVMIPKPGGKDARWASRPSAIGCSRWPCCWWWSRSLRPTSCRAPSASARARVPTEPWTR